MLTGTLEREANRMNLTMVVPYDLEQLNIVLSKQTIFKRKTPQLRCQIIEEEILKYVKLIEEQNSKEETMHNQCLGK